ncbi:MAG TPA: hypothetical protein PLW93_04725 [Candidatus Absconditabacterales bacterium]|nr:hypothetical protein [Candidatus Absconditabacterales bacterium]HNG97546.1 hypothetical protein [Candidatus Absconditabacterales bacterium]
MEEIKKYFNKLGYHDKEADIYITSYRLGSKPASIIASVSGHERVWTYKTLNKFVNDGIMLESIKSGVKHFRVSDIGLLQKMTQKKSQMWDNLSDEFAYIQTQFSQISTNQYSQTPKIALFEGSSALSNLFEDMQDEIVKKGLLNIKFFATNTFESQWSSNQKTKLYTSGFIKQLILHKIQVDSYIAQGSLVMEHLDIYTDLSIIGNLPAGDNAINFFVVGQSLYIIIYKTHPIAIKISSPELSRAMHFILEQCHKK